MDVHRVGLAEAVRITREFWRRYSFYFYSWHIECCYTGLKTISTIKICLIRPSIVVPAHNITTIFTPPLGMAYVAGALRQAGFEIQFIDALGSR